MYNINGGTIPPSVVVTSQRPDIVIIDSSTTPSTVWLYKLTAPFELNIESSNSFKKDKYQCLKNDIEENGYKCHLVPFEIGSRGYIPRRVKLSLCSMFSTTTNIKNSLEHVKFVSKISLLSSFSIFHSRKEKIWSNPHF